MSAPCKSGYTDRRRAICMFGVETLGCLRNNVLGVAPIPVSYGKRKGQWGNAAYCTVYEYSCSDISIHSHSPDGATIDAASAKLLYPLDYKVFFFGIKSYMENLNSTAHLEPYWPVCSVVHSFNRRYVARKTIHQFCTAIIAVRSRVLIYSGGRRCGRLLKQGHCRINISLPVLWAYTRCDVTRRRT